MKIYIDTADIDEIRDAFSWGIVDGITTNPSLIKKAVEKKELSEDNMTEYINQLLEVAGRDCPVSLEVIAIDEEGMVAQAEKLYEMFKGVNDNVVVKVPISTTGSNEGRYDCLKVLKRLKEKKIPTNCTLIMTPEQALLAAKAGATYVSPFAGRIDDLLDGEREGRKKTDYYPAEGKLVYNSKEKMAHDSGIVSGVDLVAKTVQILERHGLETQVIAASIRNKRQARELALAGSHIATIPFGVLAEMVAHPGTYAGMQSFTADVVPAYENLLK